MRCLVLLPLLASCGGSATQPALPSGPPAVMIAQATGPEDVIVAEVAGRPVYASCVATQARRGRLARDAALRECIDFELLAQAAEARGYAITHEVAYETRRELVSRLVETDFERRITTPADLPAQVAAGLERIKGQLDRPELRRSMYVRVPVPDKAPAADVDAARAIADRIHAALADETGLFASHVRETAERIAKGTATALDIQEYKPVMRGYTDPAYDGPLFAIPEAGRISPVVRTPWGWDIILLTELIESHHFTHDEVVPLIFADARRAEFVAWADAIRTSLGVTVLRDDTLLDPQRQAP